MIRINGRLRARTSGSTDTDALAWQTAAIANGGTVSGTTLAAVSAFITSAKANGYWTKINRLNLFCGTGLGAALTPQKVGGGSATDTNFNFVSGDYSESTGLTGNGSTKYLNTGLLASALTLNSTHIAVYNRSSVAGGYSGSNDASNGFRLASSANADSYQGCAIGSQLTSGVMPTPYGHVVGTRTASNAQSIYRNGSSIASNAAASSALPAVAVFVFARSNSGGAASYDASAYGAYSFGDGLTGGEAASYYTDMQTFQTALGRQV